MIRKVTCAFLILLSIAALTVPVFGQTVLGDTNVEPVTTSFIAQYVEALTKIAVPHATVIQSVSLYLQYTGSDGSQCLKFAIYGDDGGAYNQSSPLNQPLIASTKNGYCFVGSPYMKEIFGPGWETWNLQPSDYLSIPSAGVYWLTVLPAQSYGTIYHFTYTGLGGGNAINTGPYLYTYGYFMYAFPASYVLGFPSVFGPGEVPGNCENGFIMPCNLYNLGPFNAPYSFYVTGT
jgi:hypothetical protein